MLATCPAASYPSHDCRDAVDVDSRQRFRGGSHRRRTRPTRADGLEAGEPRRPSSQQGRHPSRPPSRRGRLRAVRAPRAQAVGRRHHGLEPRPRRPLAGDLQRADTAILGSQTDPRRPKRRRARVVGRRARARVATRTRVLRRSRGGMPRQGPTAAVPCDADAVFPGRQGADGLVEHADGISC